MSNLPDIIEIGYSWKRLLVLLAGGIVLTAGCAAMAFHLFPDMKVDAFYTAVGYFGVIFFGFAILKIGWLLVLPTDAAGTLVHTGPLPAIGPPPAAASVSPVAPSPTPASIWSASWPAASWRWATRR